MQIVSFTVEKTGTGYCAFSPEMCVAGVGATIEDAQQDARDGLADQCEYMGEDLSQYQLDFILV
jgi:hypothetical protein